MMLSFAFKIPFRYEDREVIGMDIAEDCYKVLQSIAQNEGSTVQNQIRRILDQRMLPNFSDVIRLRFREEDEP